MLYRVVEILEKTAGQKYQCSTEVFQGYLHFEALTDHDYSYSCHKCVCA